MNCSQFEKQIGDYPDREIAGDIKSAIESHAAACPVCAERLTVFRTMRAGFAALPRLSASAGFEARLERALSREQAPKAGRDRREPAWIPAWAPTFGLALAAGIALVVIGLLLSSRGPWTRGIEQVATRDIAPVPQGAAPSAEADGAAEHAAPAAVAAAASPSPDVSTPTPLARPRGERRVDDAVLAKLLDEGGVPLAPPGADREFVIDDPSDLPGFLRGGVEGEVASSPVSF